MATSVKLRGGAYRPRPHSPIARRRAIPLRRPIPLPLHQHHHHQGKKVNLGGAACLKGIKVAINSVRLIAGAPPAAGVIFLPPVQQPRSDAVRLQGI